MRGKLYVDFTEDGKRSPSKEPKQIKDPIKMCMKYRKDSLSKIDESKLPVNVHEPHGKVSGEPFVDFTDGAMDMFEISPTRSMSMREE